MKRPLFKVGFICLSCTAALAFLGQEWVITAFALCFFLVCAAIAVKKWRYPLLAAAAGVLLSACGHLMFYQTVTAPFTPLDGKEQQVSGYVISAKDYGNYYEYIIEGSLGREQKAKLRLVAFEDMELEICSAVEGRAKFALPKQDYALNYKIRGLAGDIKNPELKEAVNLPPKRQGYYSAAIVSSLSAQLDKYINKTPEIASSMLFSDQVVWQRQEYNKMAKAGVAHILAVSGLHLSIVVQGVLLLSGFLCFPRWLASLLGCAASVLVAAAAGFSPSVSRAAVMSVIMLGAYALDREKDSLTSLGVAAAVICLFSPFSVLSKGLVLSFTSTLSIILFYPVINRWLCSAASSRWDILNIPLRAVIGGISVWISAQIITLPFATVFFGYISSYGLIANLLLAPLVPLLILSAWITGILGMAGAANAAAFTGTIADAAGLFIQQTVNITSSLPFAALPVRQWTVIIWLAAACLSLIILRFYASERIMPLCLGAVLLPLLISGAAGAVFDTGCLQVTACQHSGSLILSRAGHSVIIDLPEKRGEIGNAVSCAGSKGENIDAITVSGEGSPHAAHINAIGDLSPLAVLAPHSLSNEAENRLEAIEIGDSSAGIMYVLGCAQITVTQGKALIETAGIRILKLSWGYDIIENDHFLEGVDVIVSPDGRVRSLNSSIVPRQDLWGDTNLKLKV